MAKKARRVQNPALPAIQMASGPESEIGQAMTVAMLAAAKDDCNCRACKALRTVVDQMFDQFMPEEETGA